MRDRRPPPPPQPSLPPGYLEHCYFDKDGNIIQEAIIDWPQQLADAFWNAWPQLKTSQLRNFFQYVRRQEARLTSGVTFASVKTEIQKLDSYAEKALTRKTAPIIFRKFIGQNVKCASKDEESFKAFVTHFECIIGYYRETR